MVAEAQAKASRRKPTNTSGRAPDLPILTVARIRNLYVSQCVGPIEIAAQTGLKVDQVKNLVYRKGWSALRQKRKKAVEEMSIRACEEVDSEIVDAIGNKSSVLSLSTLDQSEDVLKRVAEGDPNAPRDLQALSQAAKNFVGIFRQARQLDTQANSEGNAQINVMFVGALPRSSQRSVTNVTPAAPQSEASVVPQAGQTIDVSTSAPAPTTPPP